MLAKNLHDWTKKVKARDYYRCRICGQDGSSPLEAHHILSKKVNPALLLDTDNGITLCVECHSYTLSICHSRGYSPEELREQIYKIPSSKMRELPRGERLKKERGNEGK